MSPAISWPSTLLSIEMISVFDSAAVVVPPTGFGAALDAPPNGLNRIVSLALMENGDTARMSFDACGFCWCIWLNGPVVPFAANSQVPAVFCATVFGLGPAVAL